MCSFQWCIRILVALCPYKHLILMSFYIFREFGWWLVVSNCDFNFYLFVYLSEVEFVYNKIHVFKGIQVNEFWQMCTPQSKYRICQTPQKFPRHDPSQKSPSSIPIALQILIYFLSLWFYLIENVTQMTYSFWICFLYLAQYFGDFSMLLFVL